MTHPADGKSCNVLERQSVYDNAQPVMQTEPEVVMFHLDQAGRKEKKKGYSTEHASRGAHVGAQPKLRFREGQVSYILLTFCIR